MDMIRLPKGAAIQSYARPVEDAYFALEGCVTVGWEEAGRSAEERLGPKDLMFNPAGQAHYFRNDGLVDAEFMLLVGSPQPEEVRFRAA
jgi:mannose-6-phosphate isomerase-like protein (cupin superfamily)